MKTWIARLLLSLACRWLGLPNGLIGFLFSRASSPLKDEELMRRAGESVRRMEPRSSHSGNGKFNLAMADLLLEMKSEHSKYHEGWLAVAIEVAYWSEDRDEQH